MIPVAIVSPAAIAPQSAAPQGAAPGGVFAALFAALTEGPAVEHADPPAAPKGDGGAKVIAQLQGMTAGASPPEPEDSEAPAETKDGQAPDNAAALPVPTLPPPPSTVAPSDPQTTPAPTAALPPAAAPSPPASAAIAAPVTPGTSQAAAHDGAPAMQRDAVPKPVAEDNQDPSPALKASAPFVPAPLLASAPAQNAGRVALALPPATTPADTPAQALPPVQIVPQSNARRASAPDTNTGRAPPVTDDVAADMETLELHPVAQAKKPASATGNAKPVASDAKPTPVQIASNTLGTAIFTTSAAPDAAIPTLNIDAGIPIKTVPLSNLAHLPQGAAVTAIGAVIAGEAASGTNRFLIRLDPPELGRIDVRLRFGRDGEVHARLIADRPETVSLLMRDAATLERALNASGMRTADGIDVMLRDSSGGFAHNDGGLGGDAPAALSYRAPAITADSESDPPPAWTRPALAGRLDLTV